MDVGDAMRVGRRFGFGDQRVALDVGGEDHGDEAFLPGRGFLCDLTDAGISRERNRTGLGQQLPGDQPEQRGLAGAVLADQAGLRPLGKGDGRVVDQEARPDPVGEVVDMEHCGRFVPWPGRGRKRDVKCHRTLQSNGKVVST